MQNKLLKTSLFGFSKTDVCEYIAKINAEFNEKIDGIHKEYAAEKRLVKAADKLSALIKCEEELRQGNGEFASARESTEQALHDMHIQAVECFLEEFLPPCRMTLDEQQQ